MISIKNYQLKIKTQFGSGYGYDYNWNGTVFLNTKNMWHKIHHNMWIFQG